MVPADVLSAEPAASAGMPKRAANPDVISGVIELLIRSINELMAFP
jgi:hypothetical protein